MVPNTVTKTLHADKVYAANMESFSILEAPGYSSLSGQVRTIKSFRRPVILVDDLLHWGHRIHALDHIFKEERVEIRSIVVGLMSGQGRDLMLTQGQTVDCEYFIPNLNHWLTESSLYPFIGGDSIDRPEEFSWKRPSINMILPYVNPTFLPGPTIKPGFACPRLSWKTPGTFSPPWSGDIWKPLPLPLTLGAWRRPCTAPRLPDRGRHLRYDLSVPASSYVADDLNQLQRISMTEVIHGL